MVFSGAAAVGTCVVAIVGPYVTSHLEGAAMPCYESGPSLGQSMFGHAQLGDTRRTKRLAATFNALQRHPGGTLPQKLASPADLKALYRLCECDEVTHAAIVAAVRLYTLARMAAHQGEVLVIHDATELDYTTLSS